MIRAFARGMLAGAVAGVVAGTLDAALAWVRGPFLPALVVVAAGLFATVGAVAGAGLGIVVAAFARPWTPIWRAASRRQRIGHACAAIGCAGMLGLGLLVLGRARFSDAPPPSPTIAVAAAALAIVAVTSVRPSAAFFARHARAPVIAAATLAIAGVIAWPWFREATETIDLRPVVVGTVGLVAFAIAHVSAVPRDRKARIGFAVIVVGLAVLAPLWMMRHTPLRLVAARYAPATGGAARLVARVADFDGDGYSPLSGEGDCAPFDGRVHPFAFDEPGNGIDEDCRGGDLDPSVIRPRVVDPPAAPPPRDRPHVLLVTVDTLRADRLGAYGYARPTTPNLDALAKDSVIFERAYSSSPATNRALVTMLGGLYPSMYTEATEYGSQLSSRRVLLAERLRDAGYETAAIATIYTLRRENLRQGLGHLDLAGVHDVRAEPLTDRALAYLDRAFATPRTKPLFLWLHYYDPHGPYNAPAPYRKWDDGKRATDDNRSDRYDAEVHYVDAQLGRLIAKLGELGILDDTLVVVTSDHGEEFLEHGGWYHTEELYDESIRVPWIVRGPGLAPRRIDDAVGLVDLMPTILDLVDIAPPNGIEGRSQAAAVRGTGPVDAHPILLEQWKHKTDRVQKIGVVDGTTKLVLDLENQIWELYDLVDDPGEQHERHGEDPITAERLREILLDYWARVSAARRLGPPEGSF